MGPSYAGTLGPLAFVLVLLRGLIHGSSSDGVLMTAVFCMLVFAAVGYVAGRVAEQVLVDSVRHQFQAELKVRETQTKVTNRHHQ